MLLEMTALLILAASVRLLPSILVPHGSGIDQWFWRAYIEALRREGHFPPRLEQFRLDEAQWYPPLFPLLLARLPAAVFERHAGQLAVFIDLLRMLLLMVATRWLSDSDGAALVAGAAYAITPLLVTYNMQLNPRGLGALLLDALWLCVAAVVLAQASSWFWLLALLLGALMLLTHKMTTQLFFFTAAAGACLTLDVRLALLIPGSMVAAFVMSGGFYRFVLRAHGDVVRFWYRNWRWSGSNPVLESPIYGEPDFESPSKYYSKGFAAWIRRLQFVIGFNVWMPVVLALGAIAWFAGHEFTPALVWALAWLALVFAFALLTTLVPALRCLGQGYLYGYNGAFPAALALGLTWLTLRDTWYWWVVTGATCAACLAVLAVYFRKLRASRTLKIDADLDAALSRLAALPKGPVMCLPQQWHDIVAYRARQPVVFGGHGYGFRLLEPVFPRLLLPVREMIQRYEIRYLLTYGGYLNAKFLADLPPANVEQFGDYRLYRFHEVTVSSCMRQSLPEGV